MRMQKSMRTQNLLLQVRGGLQYRALAMLVSFAIVPVMIAFLGTELFGIWSTFLSILTWIVFFDLGIGNGLRNLVGAALAKGEEEQARDAISAGYTFIGGLVLIISLALISLAFFLPWQSIFNTSSVPESELRYTFQIGLFFVLLNLWVGLVANLFTAVQKTSYVELGRFIANALILVFVLLLAQLTEASLVSLAFIYGAALVIPNLLLTHLFFGSRPALRPRMNFKSEHARPLLSYGAQFFSIQLAVLLIFTTDKILITQFFGPEYVTSFDVVLKVFSIVTILHALINAPLWPAYTEAYERGDMNWIRSVLYKQMILILPIILVLIILAHLMPSIIAVWIGEELVVPQGLILATALMVFVMSWNNIFGTILNGIGKVRLGSVYAIISGLLNIPLSYFFAVILDFGVAGIILATISSLFISAVLSPIQVYFFIFTSPSRGFLYSLLR